jgi:dihydroflavonol-4-reductase
MTSEKVLVIERSELVGTRCILRLLQAGYAVRTTVRSRAREWDVRAMLRVGGLEPGDTVDCLGPSGERLVGRSDHESKSRLI